MIQEDRENRIEKFDLVAYMNDVTIKDQEIHDFSLADAQGTILIAQGDVARGDRIPFRTADHWYTVIVALAMSRWPGDDWGQIDIERLPHMGEPCPE